MNKLSEEKLQIILGDELLLEAVKAVFNETIEKEKPNVGEADNTLLGEKYRAYESSKEIVKKGFVNLISYKVNSKEKSNFEKSR